jgi:hypothetical protein
MKIHFLALALFTSLAIAQTPSAVPSPFENAPEPDEETSVADPPAAPQALQVQLEYIELSHEALTKLLFLAEPKTSDAALLRKQLQEMVAKNEAKVLETQIAVGSRGQKFTAGSVLEFIYPVEYDAPTVRSDLTKDSLPSTTYISPMMPTAYDTKKIGGTLEVEEPLSTINKGLINIRIGAELTWHTGNTTWLEDKDSIGNNHKVEMPDFYSLSVDTSITCIGGQYSLVAVLSPKDAKGEVDMSRKVVMLLKCDTPAVR